jgi:hypothetical protein
VLKLFQVVRFCWKQANKVAKALSNGETFFMDLQNDRELFELIGLTSLSQKMI